MEPFPSPLAFLSLNLASEISSFLNFFDLQNLGLVSKKIRHIFYENVNCFNSILTQKSCPIQKTIDSIDELKVYSPFYFSLYINKKFYFLFKLK